MTNPQAPKPPVFAFSRGGFTCTLSMGEGEAPEGGERGEAAFSKASRRRLIRAVGEIDQDQAGPGLFVTLTYPGSFCLHQSPPDSWKRDLDVWTHRLVRRHPTVWGVWRIEPQKRGAPHYHLLLWGVPRIEREWLSQSWWEVVGSGERSHLVAGTQVQRMRSHRGALVYAAKYLAKPCDSWVGLRVGRWWGRIRARSWCRSSQRVELTERQWLAVRRVLRRHARLVGRWERTSSEKRWRRGARCMLAGSDAARLVAWVQSQKWESPS